MISRNFVLAVVLICSLFVTGCNAFEAFDQELDARDSQSLVDEGNLKLAAADFSNALALFERALSEGSGSDSAYRGRASARAGLAGFNMFSVLDRLQNAATPGDSSAVIFSAARLIKNLELLDQAIDDMNLLTDPGHDDLLFRSLMASLSAAATLLQKYDTNLNHKLDAPDQIDFDTNDNANADWPTLYQRLSVVSSARSLEKAFIELTRAFDGRGSTWITLSPLQGVSHTGIYTPANRSTITAVGDFAIQLKTANAWFNNSTGEFKTLLMALDGAN
ncbi:MAG TPA: hypothetical protein PLM07_09840 [Candidatus Rifleibacterium sp.]|nr:hypothetical protein [Candidatus Rifleibacterium sp.]HPT46188.1 hypothetical protein [Candidatus Rifleibacterium sp.]